MKALGDKQTIFSAIKADILNTDCFKKCGPDFKYKTNAIFEGIRNRSWIPINQLISKKNEDNKVINSLQQKIFKLRLDIREI